MFTKTIDEITETLIDYRGKTPPKTSCGVKLITAKIIKDGFVQNNNLEYISEEIYGTWMRRGMPKQWDILITTEAPLGEVAQLRTTEKNCPRSTGNLVTRKSAGYRSAILLPSTQIVICASGTSNEIYRHNCCRY